MEQTRTAAAAVAAGAVPVALGLAMGWPAPVWAPAGAAVVALVLLVSATRVRPAPGPSPVPAAAPPPVPDPDPQPPVEPPYRRTSVTGVALPSAVPDYDFLFSATVWWREVAPRGGVAHAAPGSLAIEAVLARARAVTEQEHPGRPELVRHRLDGVLGTPSPDTSGIVVAMAEGVGLGLSAADRERLDRLSEVRKAEEVWEHERRHERSRRAYLGEDVLKSPGSAVVWWLARNEEEVREAVDMIGPLARLAAAANDEAVDALYAYPAAGAPFLDRVVPAMAAGGGAAEADERGPSVVGPLNSLMRDIRLQGADARTVYAHRVARITEAAGRPEEAARIQESLVEDAVPAEDPDGVPGRRGFVVGPVRPLGAGESEPGPVTSAWEVLRGPVNGDPRGAGASPEEGWGGADQSH
ncbi:hypothetical protein [Kitasatospora putterlickiae]